MKLFIRLSDIAEMFGGISESAALALLASHDVRPVDLGNGRKHGKIWYAPAIQALAAELHEEAQIQSDEPKKPKIKAKNKQSLDIMHIVSAHSKKELKLLLQPNGIPM